MKPALFLAVIAGGVTGTATFSLLNVGLRSTPSPGSIISLLLMSPKSISNYIGLIIGVTLATLASFIVAAIVLKRDKSTGDDDLAAAQGKMSDMKSGNAEAASATDAEPADVIASYKDVDHIILPVMPEWDHPQWGLPYYGIKSRRLALACPSPTRRLAI